MDTIVCRDKCLVTHKELFLKSSLNKQWEIISEDKKFDTLTRKVVKNATLLADVGGHWLSKLLIRFYKKLVISRKHSDCAFPFSVNIFCQILEHLTCLLFWLASELRCCFVLRKSFLYDPVILERMYIERLWLYRVFCPFFHLSNAVTDCAIFASRRWSAIGSWLFDDFITQLSR